MGKVKQIIKSSLFKGSVIVLAANIVANFFNYLYHFISGRLLSVSDYGLLQSLIALNYFLGVLIGAFSFVVINIVGQVKDSGVFWRVKLLEKKSIILSLFCWLAFLLLFPLLKSFLHFESFLVYFVFTLPVLLSFLPTLYQSALRGQLKFTEFAVINILSTFAKTLFCLVLILAGWKILGALASIFISSIVAVCLGWWWVRKIWPKGKEVKKIGVRVDVWRFSVLSLITSFCFISIYSTDILLVRHFFSGWQAGLYAAVSILGKIIFFGATAVLLVAFPLFVRYKRNLEKLRQVFWLSFLFIGGICLAGLFIYKLFPEVIVGLLYGDSYSQAATYLFKFGVFVALLAVLNLFTQLLLSVESNKAGFLAGLVAVLQILLIILNHRDIEAVINNSIVSVVFGLILGLFFVIKVVDGKRKV